MDTRQKRTFLIYSRGIVPEQMTLGDLHLDPANPIDDERTRLACPLQMPDLQKWVHPPDDESPCKLQFTASCEWLVSAGIASVLSLQTARGRHEEVIVSAKKGRRLMIRRPETFLNEVILSDPDAIAWLRDVLTISKSMYYLSKVRLGKGRHPRVWMLTGIQYLSDTEINTVSRRSRENSVSASIPPPEPLAAALSILTGTSLSDTSLSFKSDSGSTTSSGQRQERVWAAQFTPLAVDFQPSGSEELHLPPQITLKKLPDLGHMGMRDEEGTTDDTEDRSVGIVGLDNSESTKWDNSPESMLEATQELDWSTLYKFLNVLDSNTTEQ